jgi:hypothetical protein
MPSLADHQSNDIVKLLAVGDAMVGKTGSLASLVPNYNLRILDLDNKLDVLKQFVLRECPAHASKVEYRTLRDNREATALGATIKGQPKAFVETVKMLSEWKYKNPDGSEVNLGRPADWGPDCILVIDSLSRLCDAAYDWQEALTPAGRSGEKDGRAIYGNAQDVIENMISMITSPLMNTNVILIAHGSYMDLPDGTSKIFPQGVGQKLSPKIPQYFPNMVRYKNIAGKRTIQLKSDMMIDLANAAPFAMPETLDVETGLGKFFAILRGQPAPAAVEKPKVGVARRV